MEKIEKKNIILSTAGTSVSKLGSLIYTFAIGLYVLKITGSGQTFAATLMFGILPRVVLGPFIGNMTDRLNKKMLIVGSDLLSGILMILLFIYALKGDLTIPIIYGTTLLLAVSSTFLETAFSAAQRDIVRVESLTRLGSIRHSTDSIINLASPLIGGLIYALVPISAFLLINAVSFLVSSFSEVFIDFNYNKTEKNPEEKKSFFQDMKSGFSYFKNNPEIVSISKYALLLNFFLTSFSVVLPFGLITLMKIDESIYGLLMSFISLGALGGAILVGKQNSKMSKSLFIRGMGSISIFFLLMGISMHSSFGSGLLVMVLIGITGFMLLASATAINIPMGVYMQTTVDPAYLGRVFSIIGTLTGAMTPLAYIFFGMMTEYFSPFLIITGCGICTVIITVTSLQNKNLKTIDRKSKDIDNKLAGENA